MVNMNLWALILLVVKMWSLSKASTTTTESTDSTGGMIRTIATTFSTSPWPSTSTETSLETSTDEPTTTESPDSTTQDYWSSSSSWSTPWSSPWSSTDTDDSYQSSDTGYTGVTNLSVLTIGGIVVGCAALVSLVVIVVAMKVFGGGGSAVGSVGTASSGGPKERWAKPQMTHAPPPYQGHHNGQYTSPDSGHPQHKERDPSNKYAGGRIVDFY